MTLPTFVIVSERGQYARDLVESSHSMTTLRQLDRLLASMRAATASSTWKSNGPWATGRLPRVTTIETIADQLPGVSARQLLQAYLRDAGSSIELSGILPDAEQTAAQLLAEVPADRQRDVLDLMRRVVRLVSDSATG